MFKNKEMIKYLPIAVMCAGLAACGGGGGGGEDGEGDNAAPVAYKETTPGPGSTVVDAEVAVTSGTINYSHYRMHGTSINEKTWATPSVLATVNFNATTKAGSIQFPALGGTATVSTTDAYTTASWTGPFTAGLYKFNGNVLMGCNTGAGIATEATQVFVSSSLERIQGGGPLDDLDGHTFDIYDCSIVQNAQVSTMKFNTDGTLTMTMAPRVLTRNEKINMLNPESWGGALIDGKYFGGNVFRYGKNGINKYVIVIQTATGNFDSRFRYLIAVQK